MMDATYIGKYLIPRWVTDHRSTYTIAKVVITGFVAWWVAYILFSQEHQNEGVESDRLGIR
jgi:hypothetical protein